MQNILTWGWLYRRGGCRVIPAQIVLFVAIADNHFCFLVVGEAILGGFLRYGNYYKFKKINDNKFFT